MLSLTGCKEQPEPARQRLGLREDQLNALVRIILRPLSSTLTDDEANAIRDDVYRAVHRGPVMELTTSR